MQTLKSFDDLAVACGLQPTPPPPKKLGKREKLLLRNARFCERHKGYKPPHLSHNPIYTTGVPPEKTRGKGYGGISTAPNEVRESIFTAYEKRKPKRKHRKAVRLPYDTYHNGDHALNNGRGGM